MSIENREPQLYKASGFEYGMLGALFGVLGTSVVAVMVFSDYGQAVEGGKLYKYINTDNRTIIRRTRANPINDSQIDVYQISGIANRRGESVFKVAALDSASQEEALDYLRQRCGDITVVGVDNNPNYPEKLVLVKDSSCING